MRRAFIALTILALTVPAVGAQDRPAVSFEHLTVGSTAVSLAGTTTNPANNRAAQYCRGVVEDANIRVRVDGVAATASVGSLAEPGAIVELSGADSIRLFSAIRTTGANGALPVTCYNEQPAAWRGSLSITPPMPGVSTSGTGATVHATAPSLTSATITAGALSGAFTGNPVFIDRPYFRDEFDHGTIVVESDFTAAVVTDGGVNIVLGNPGGLLYSFREELAKTISSWVHLDGEITISADDDNAEDGVEIVIGGLGTSTTTGMIVAGTSGACFSASFTIADISDTDQLTVGWRQNETFVDLADNMGYTIVNTVGINATDGSIVSEQEVSEATDVDDSGVNWADGERRALKVCISAAGVPTAFYTDASPDATSPTWNAITMTETGSTLTAGTQLWPFISFVQGATPGADVNVQYIQLEDAP